MANLIIPGRHIITSSFMVEYLTTILQKGTRAGRIVGDWDDTQKINHVIVPITSANQHGSRYNPVPLYARLIGLERTLAPFREKYEIRISYVPVPHFSQLSDFALYTIKYIQAHVMDEIDGASSVVWTSTPPLIEGYRRHGYAVLPAEWNNDRGEYDALPPNEIITAVALAIDPEMVSEYNLLSEATKSVWRDMPEIPDHIRRLYTDPLLTEGGSLTQERNYASYAVGMSHSALMDVKFNDIKGAVVEGRIVDEGCADGALMVRLAETFRDSDIIGIDITGEFIARVEERQRAGEFGSSFVFVYQRNLLQPIFEPGSITTTICNSTLHELWSYGQQKESVMAYLQEKFRQLVFGGRLVIRDVVGPHDKEDIVYLKLNDNDGLLVESTDEGLMTADTSALSTESKWYRFAHDFLHDLRVAGRRDAATKVVYEKVEIDGERFFKVRLKDAVEFLSRKDYHDNWVSEMNEEFAFWDFEEWVSALTSVGFVIINEDSANPAFSKAYTNSWIVENRWRSCATIYKMSSGGELIEQPYPVTNMVLVGEKPFL